MFYSVKAEMMERVGRTKECLVTIEGCGGNGWTRRTLWDSVTTFLKAQPIFISWNEKDPVAVVQVRDKNHAYELLRAGQLPITDGGTAETRTPDIKETEEIEEVAQQIARAKMRGSGRRHGGRGGRGRGRGGRGGRGMRGGSRGGRGGVRGNHVRSSRPDFGHRDRDRDFGRRDEHRRQHSLSRGEHFGGPERRGRTRSPARWESRARSRSPVRFKNERSRYPSPYRSSQHSPVRKRRETRSPLRTRHSVSRRGRSRSPSPWISKDRRRSPAARTKKEHSRSRSHSRERKAKRGRSQTRRSPSPSRSSSRSRSRSRSRGRVRNRARRQSPSASRSPPAKRRRRE